MSDELFEMTNTVLTSLNFPRSEISSFRTQELLNQLKPGGRLVCPVGNVLEQYLMVYDKAVDGTVREHTSSGVRYVPLTNEQDQRRPRGIFS